MIRILMLLTGYYLSLPLSAQDSRDLYGVVADQNTNEVLKGASITIYSAGKISGNISNEEGKFELLNTAGADSIKFSMIGYHNKVITPALFKTTTRLVIRMETSPVKLDELFLKPMTPFEIVQKAIENTTSCLPATALENTVFYREVISDSTAYYSVAEAIFNTQYFPQKRSYKLRLQKGRSKDDVAITRLFEDFHPGGGPEGLAGLSFSIGFPKFLTTEKMKWFVYRMDSVVAFNGRKLYVIAFDQKDDVRQALDKGQIYIDAANFSITRYTAFNSPKGTPYIKSLGGPDRLFAELLQIDFKRKGWSTEVDFKISGQKIVIDHAKASYFISYRQPKKNIDLDLAINTEMVVLADSNSIHKPITSSDEWKRKNIIANLPTDFDKDFWGNNSIISPTEKIGNIIAAISQQNKDVEGEAIDAQWSYHQKNSFISRQQNDSIILIPVMRNNWNDDRTGGMIFREIAGDFVVETAISLTKRSNSAEQPDNGFQQAGIIIRTGNQPPENNIILSVGTGGNPTPKFFLRKTENDVSKGPVDKIGAMRGFLKMERKGKTVTAFFREHENSEWQPVNSYQLSWATDPLQVGLMVMAQFAGSGPKMKPDMKALFTGFTIKKAG